MNDVKKKWLIQRMKSSMQRIEKLVELEAPTPLIENERANLASILDKLIED